MRGRAALRFLLSLIVFIGLFPGPALRAADRPSPAAPFFEKGRVETGFLHRSAVPNLARSDDGTIFCVFAADLKSIELIRTRDSGRTWSPPVKVMGCPRAGYIADPNVLVAGREISVFASFVPAPSPPFARSETLRATSVDGGRTWSAPEPLPIPHKYVSGKTHVPVWLDDKTVVMGYSWDIPADEGRASAEEATMDARAGVLISRDRGRTWTPAGDVHVNLRMGADEPALVRLRNGDLFAVVRTTSRPFETRSRDGGLTWDEPRPGPFEGYNSPSALLRLRDGAILRVWDNDSRRRFPLVVSLSRDEGASWSTPRTIAEPGLDDRGRPGFDTACYPSIAQAEDGTIVVAWWQTSAAGSDLGYARFNRAWIESARRVDFSYAFAPPHRLTIGRPDDSRRTLLDLQPGSLRLAWSFEDLTRFPLGSFMTPTANWEIRLTPQVDGRPFARSRWTRLDGYLPALDNAYEDGVGVVRLEALGAASAALVRIEIENFDTSAHRFVLRCDSASWGENRAWVDPGRWTGDSLVAGWRERADRLLLAGLGADRTSLAADGRPPGPTSMVLVWDVPPGEKRSGWLVRPYDACLSDLAALRAADWGREFEASRAEWRTLLAGARRPAIPDSDVADAFLACLADLFIMREPLAGGYLGSVPGTEVYRAANSFEASVVAVALDQVGLHDLSVMGHRVCLEMQGPDGEWDDPAGWGHLMWGGAGFKAWAALEHYRLTRDRNYLEGVYPRLAASARWREKLRAGTRLAAGPERPLTYGLMPRGFGDCGLADGDDNYGVFLPHNIWAVYADRLAAEAAEILGRADDLKELRRIFETSRADLLSVLDRGAIREDGYRWIPGAPGKRSGSRWGVLNALYPCGLLAPGDELITGTLRFIESRMSPGGIPLHTGWMPDGMWVAIALDNVAEAHLARGEGDAAAAYLYAALNHGTPLLTWCEERGQEAGTTKCSGDRQHLWTPVAVVRALRDMFVMERPDGLHLALGTAREWLGTGEPIGFDAAPTRFGRVSYEMRFDAAKKVVTGEVRLEDTAEAPPPDVFIHVRLPAGRRLLACGSTQKTALGADGETVIWRTPRGSLKFSAKTT